MPIRDHSLNIKSWFINCDLFKNLITNTYPNPTTNPINPTNQTNSITNQTNSKTKSNSFCELLLDKYYECAKETKTPQQTCKSEYEIIYLTRCAEILENDKQNKNKTKI